MDTTVAPLISAGSAQQGWVMLVFEGTEPAVVLFQDSLELTTVSFHKPSYNNTASMFEKSEP